MSIPPHSANNRIAKLKLMKDLKYGKVHLRQSLLEMSEFEDVDKLFKNKKQFYSISEQDIPRVHQIVQENQEQSNILISPIQRIQQYRKEKLNKRMKQKMTMEFGQKKKSQSKPRVPKTMKMLQKFEDKYRNQMPVSYKQQLRQSQLNLQKIKRNDKTKFQVNSPCSKPLYHSRVVSNGRVITQPQTLHENKRFMSLKTSLPQKQKFIYPSIRQIMQGKLRQSMKGPIIDIKSIQNTLDNYLNHSIKKIKIRIDRDHQSRNSINSPLKIKSQVSNRQFERKRVRSNVEKSFNRSEESSKTMIQTMSSFYETKHQKKQLFYTMYKNLKYDRPLTSSIRRKNYTVLGKQVLHPITDYREVSEEQRRHLRSKNYEFYCKLIDGLQIFHEQDIPTTVYIVEEVKRIFETEYMITPQILKQLVESVNKMKMDHKTEQTLNSIAEFLGLNLVFSPQETFYSISTSQKINQ